jgi:hypothetical protein
MGAVRVDHGLLSRRGAGASTPPKSGSMRERSCARSPAPLPNISQADESASLEAPAPPEEIKCRP